MTLIKSGYYNCNPETVLNSPVDLVMHTYNYELFTRDYEETINEMNRNTK